MQRIGAILEMPHAQSNSDLFLFAAVLLVPLSFTRFGLGAVLRLSGRGFGDRSQLWACGIAMDVEGIAHVSELGIALLLFVIGLELQPSRLWVLRRSVFGIGGAQVLVTGLAFAVIAYTLGLNQRAAIVAGLGLAMSSTALVMQTLAEKSQLTSRHGREAFAVLLFQDLAVIPLLALMPLLGGERIDHGPSGLATALKALAIIGGAIIASRTLIRPLFRAAMNFWGRVIFTAPALLWVLGMSLLWAGVGLSMSLGAFLAGVLLADSEYRHELEAVIGPFKSLLLGLFLPVGWDVGECRLGARATADHCRAGSRVDRGEGRVAVWLAPARPRPTHERAQTGDRVGAGR